MTDTRAPWRKSTYSGSQANCVEVADAPGHVLVRDTKNNGRGLVLTVTPGAWRAFLGKIKLARHEKTPAA